MSLKLEKLGKLLDFLYLFVVLICMHSLDVLAVRFFKKVHSIWLLLQLDSAYQECRNTASIATTYTKCICAEYVLICYKSPIETGRLQQLCNKFQDYIAEAGLLE